MSDISVTENSFDTNMTAAMRVLDCFPVFAGNTAVNNGRNGILLETSTIDGTGTLGADLPFVVENHDLRVGGTGWLNIEPGSTFKFGNGYGLTVDGGLAVSGASGNEAVFTSLSDDILNDTNNDGAATTPMAGEWPGININSMNMNQLTYCEVRYADFGVEVFMGNADISNSLFESCIVGAFYAESTGSVIDNSFGLNDNGLAMMMSDISVTGNSFDTNMTAAMRVWDCFPVFAGNTAVNNGCNGILLETSTIDDTGTLGADLPFVVESHDVTVGEAGWLNIEPGSTFKFGNGYGLTVNGGLTVSGASGNEVIFTSINDDVVNDTNNDGAASTPMAGEWPGININSMNMNQLTYCEVRYADFGVEVFMGNADISNSEFSYNWSGVSFQSGSTGIVTGNNFMYNDTGVHIDISSNPDLGDLNDADPSNDGNNSFVCNNLEHIYNGNPATVMAENNYIGNTPPNPAKISGAVDYEPYLDGPSVLLVSDAMNIKSGDSIVVSWSDGTPACGYSVYRGGAADRASMVNQTGVIYDAEWIDPGATTDGNDYYYDIRIEGD